jgi:hypothetical protein
MKKPPIGLAEHYVCYYLFCRYAPTGYVLVMEEVMTDTQPAPIFFTNKRMTCMVDAPHGPIAIEVSTPDLRSAPTSTWGDWGPMVTCTLASDERVTLRYRCMTTEREATYEIAPRTLSLCSPALAIERDRAPFFLELTDVARGLRLRGYMNAEGNCVELRPELLINPIDFEARCLAEAVAVQGGLKAAA